MSRVVVRGARWLALSSVMIIIAVFAVTIAVAAEPEQQAAAEPAAVPAPPVEQASAPVAADGMVAYIDPATGKLTSSPTAEQRAAMQAALAAALDRSQDGLYDVVLPDGTVMRDLQGRFQSATVVRTAPDGSVHQECTTNPEVLDAPLPETDDASPVAVAE